jgi:hypothetical protein
MGAYQLKTLIFWGWCSNDQLTFVLIAYRRKAGSNED